MWTPTEGRIVHNIQNLKYVPGLYSLRQHLVSENGGSRAPGCMSCSHRLMSLAVVIFGEIPGALCVALGIRCGQRSQKMLGTLQASITCQPHGIKSCEHGPQAPIVIRVGL